MRALAPSLFVAALLAFTLPFATVSCGSTRVEPSGADFVLRVAPPAESAQDEKVAEVVVDVGGGLATAAFLAFAIALVASVRTGVRGWAALSGAAGVAALIVLKTRGGSELVDTEARLGGILAALGGAAGTAVCTAMWLRGRRQAGPWAPGLIAALMLAGYLLPQQRGGAVSLSYADSLNVREPWSSAFWLLPAVVAVALALRRARPAQELEVAALGVYLPATVVLLYDIGRTLDEPDASIGPGAVLLLAGIALSATWLKTVRAGRWAVRPGGRAPAPVPAPQAVPEAQEAGQSPPAAP